MISNLSYRKGSESDIPIIYKLAYETWNEHYIEIITQQQIDYMLHLMYSEESLIKQLAEGHCFYLLVNNGIEVGFMSIIPGENLFLNKFYILKNQRNIGAGQWFFKAIFSLPNFINKEIRLYVNRKNFKSINFYFKMGFVIEKVVDQNIGNNFYMNDYIMLKKP